ncbi:MULTISPECIES: WD40 repeat domain-containing protein [Nostocales]|uniref:Uncharacterized protein n=3 Tax=Nostocales TaxID=1161 RepID=A0A0C1N4C6_9CYAN|nr:hypothetical protein [Tolypothrix bouteillei]KAF3889251.1 hypothetical protein DA73_0400030035 [Tolypothrix bouteillei VB521301]
MDNRIINASLSTQSVTFKPGGVPSTFEVTVINGSDRFAAFQMEVIAAGANRSSGSQWYRLSPEVAAAKPPGGSTQFTVEIFDTPLPAFTGTINLTVRIFSPQLREERKLVLRLTIQPGSASTLLILELPVRRFQVYPRNSVDIVARVRNMSPHSVETLLRLDGLSPSWLTNSAERRLLLEPGAQIETTFPCQPPSADRSPSEDYPFTVQAISRDGASTQADGVLEVLPVGFVGFTAEPQQQTIPDGGKWWRLPDRKSNSTSFQLLFKNSSNLRQQVEIQLQGRDWRKVTHTSVPENADLTLGDVTKVLLYISTKRHWIGLPKTLRLEAKALLSDGRLGSTDPTTQSLDVKVLPVIPLWLLLSLLAILAALLALLLMPAPIGHTDIVNSVSFSGDSFSVVSGSDDCTIRIWSVDGDRLNPKGMAASPIAASCDGKKPSARGLLAVIGQAVRTLRFMPKDNDRIAAGLESGEIQFWNVRTREKEYTLRDPNDMTSDRVFALVFTENSLNLFSAHGSGKVRLWKRSGPGTNFESNPQVIDLGKDIKYPIRALALSEDETILATAGDFKRVVLMNPSSPETTLRQLSGSKLVGGDGDYVWNAAFAPGSHILATSDSDGFISIWDLDNCTVNNATPDGQQKFIQQQCQLRDRWRASQISVRGLNFYLDGSKLVSAGDDGKIIIWPLKSDKTLDRAQAANGQLVKQNVVKINTLDLTKDVQGTMVVDGDDRLLVQLHRLPQ